MTDERSIRPVLALLVVAVLTPAALFADRVTLKDGRRLRGVDLVKRSKKLYQFTLEDSRTVVFPVEVVTAHEKSPPGDTVDFRGEEMALRDKIRILRKEAKARETKMMRAVERWSRGGAKSEDARREFEALSANDRERYLGHTLRKSSYKSARALAAERLAEFKTSHSVSALARAAVKDRSDDVRKASMTSLRIVNHSRTGDYFVPYLVNSEEKYRIRASDAISSFPTAKAVPVLISVVSRIWTDFGRGYFFQGVQRAYIADYELVSGGTGFQILEVADPVVRTMQTGVVLDVHVKKVESRTHIRTLGRITGQDFGTDMKAWRAWWESEQAKERQKA